MTPQELYKKMAELAAAGTPFVLATVVEAYGSTPRKPGAKMLILEDGSTIDTVGGGKVEQQVVVDALDALQRGASRTVKYELRPTGKQALGMICGGETTIFLEVNLPAQTLVIAGAGHIGQKLSAMAKLLDFRVVVVDNRPEFATQQTVPAADEVICGDPSELPRLVNLDRNSYIVIITHGHVHDKDTLQAVLGCDAAYIGMIGSRTKVRTVLEQLAEEGADPEALRRVYAPIGIDLGGNAPGEIAVSIMAEIIAHRHGRLNQLRASTNPLTGEEDVAAVEQVVGGSGGRGASGAGGCLS